MKHLILALSILSICLGSQAKVEALFHPYDNTMEKIADIFMNAESTIDMALYNIDSKERNPVIAALMTDKIQAKIQSGELKVRIIFEGYMTKEKNFEKMGKLEALGINAKYLGKSQKMHHKFATVDTASATPTLITGSANWSMMSQNNYNENTLFFTGEPGITNNFQREFELLWTQAKEYGIAKEEYYNIVQPGPADFMLEPGLNVRFNTDNFDVVGKKFKKSKDTTYVLTREIVAAIDSAQNKIEIATTRLKLRPIYDAIRRAARRGVKVKIIVTMGEYEPKFLRKKNKLRKTIQKGKKTINCNGSFERKCSTSQNFAMALSQGNYNGKDNVKVRVKYFDLRHGANLLKQMHSKYMIIDDKEVLTGSFNWSYSAEYNHIENLISLSGESYSNAVSQFNDDFNHLWNLERNLLKGKYKLLNQKKTFKCNFTPMSLTVNQIDKLLNKAKKVNKSLKRFCKGAAKVDLAE